MSICPTCGSSNDPCPDCEIASWIESPLSPREPGQDRACTSCGFSGEMIDEGRGTSCPACGVVLPPRRSDLSSRVTQLVECPECGCRIGVTAEDQGKTVICPGCSYFLGTPCLKPGAGRRR